MTHVVPNGSNVERKDVAKSQRLNERPVLLMGCSPGSLRIKKDGDWGDHVGGTQIALCGLQDVESMLEVVVCVFVAVYLSQMVDEGANLF